MILSSGINRASSHTNLPTRSDWWWREPGWFPPGVVRWGSRPTQGGRPHAGTVSPMTALSSAGQPAGGVLAHPRRRFSCDPSLHGQGVLEHLPTATVPTSAPKPPVGQEPTWTRTGFARDQARGPSRESLGGVSHTLSSEQPKMPFSRLLPHGVLHIRLVGDLQSALHFKDAPQGCIHATDISSCRVPCHFQRNSHQ